MSCMLCFSCLFVMWHHHIDSKLSVGCTFPYASMKRMCETQNVFIIYTESSIVSTLNLRFFPMEKVLLHIGLLQIWRWLSITAGCDRYDKHHQRWYQPVPLSKFNLHYGCHDNSVNNIQGMQKLVNYPIILTCSHLLNHLAHTKS